MSASALRLAPEEGYATLSTDMELLSQEQSYEFDEIDELEYKYAVEEAVDFQPSAHLIQGWRDSFKQKGDKVFAKFDSEVDKFDKTTMPQQCTDQVKKWAKAITPKESTPPNPTFINQHPECRDPWKGKEQCAQAFEIPSYRLSDLIRYRPEGLPAYTSLFIPQSIGAKYEEKMKQSCQKKWPCHRRPGSEQKQINNLNEVVSEKMYDDFVKPSPDEVVVHLRLGDSYAAMRMGNGYYHSKLDTAKKLGISKATLIFGDHKISQMAVLRGANETDKNKGLQKAFDRVSEVEAILAKKGFKVTKRMNMNTDCDVIYMANSKYFVKAGGGFSHLMEQLVQKRGGKIL